MRCDGVRFQMKLAANNLRLPYVRYAGVYMKHASSVALINMLPINNSLYMAAFVKVGHGNFSAFSTWL